MLITISSEATSDERSQLMNLLCRLTGSQQPLAAVRIDKQEVIALEGKALDLDARKAIAEQAAVERTISVKTPYKLVSKALKQETVITIGSGENLIRLGGSDNPPVVIAGPCAVESKEQLLQTARAVRAAGGQILRGGAFKPRTSPYQFQGLGIEGLHLLAEAREETGLPIITEVMEPGMVETVGAFADILQIGSRNMQNYSLLQAAGRNSFGRPVMLKRGLSSTLDEWLLAAEYVVAAGNPNVILCERGIRSFDPQTRNMFDLTCVPLLHELTHLPIVVDPSHATGKRELVPTMSRAGIAAGANGLILETHIDPDNALCDGRQSITPAQLKGIVQETRLLTQLFKGSLSLTHVA